MSESINLSYELEKRLPAELISLMRQAGEVASQQGQKLYLVGGVVRDLLLGRANFDLDLVVEGEAIDLAQQLAGIVRGKIVIHRRFHTAKLRWDKWSVDLATARSETYAKPGALPRVKPGSVNIDLSRRDFTINTMAIELMPAHYGQLLDPYHGRDDLEHKLIRILHEKSFIDDATRIWRALRYEQRLDFRLEPETLRLLERDIAMLETISGDRLRHELELVLKEKFPEKVLGRADELGVLAKLHPALKGDGWLAERFGEARQLSHPDLPAIGLYLALLTYRLSKEESEELLSCLRLSKSLTQTLRDTISLKGKLGVLADPELTPSGIYHLLYGYCQPALMSNYLASDSPVARQHINLFLTKLRYVKPSLTGTDLLRMGIPPGPSMKEILQRLHDARLDGKVTSKKDEERLVKGWFDNKT